MDVPDTQDPETGTCNDVREVAAVREPTVKKIGATNFKEIENKLLLLFIIINSSFVEYKKYLNKIF